MEVTADGAFELLKTCREIYLEAVEILYSTNTFVLHDLDTLVTLPRSIAPQCLDSIRTLRLLKSSRVKMPYPHPRWRPYSPTFGDTWRLFWEVVVRMRGLKDLEVYLEYGIDYYRVEDEPSSVTGTREGMLRPLLETWGLERFWLRYGVVSKGDVCLEPQEESFRQDL